MGNVPDNRFMLIRGLRQILRIPSPTAPLTDAAPAPEDSTSKSSPGLRSRQRRGERSRTTSARGLGYLVESELGPELPETLQFLGNALIEVLQTESGDPQSAFLAFTNKAFQTEATADIASQFILHRFANDLATLGKLVTPEVLIAELKHGSSLVAQAMSLRWDLTGENRQLLRLAQAAVEAKADLTHPSAAEFVIALATAIAFQEPDTSAQMIAAARPHIAADCEGQLLADAEQCLDAGRVLQRMSPIAQNVWQQRLRLADRKWNWGNNESKRALTALASYLRPDSPSTALFRQIVPESRWATLFDDKSQPPISASEPAQVEATAEESRPALETQSSPSEIVELPPAPALKAAKEAPLTESPATLQEEDSLTAKTPIADSASIPAPASVASSSRLVWWFVSGIMVLAIFAWFAQPENRVRLNRAVLAFQSENVAPTTPAPAPQVTEEHKASPTTPVIAPQLPALVLIEEKAPPPPAPAPVPSPVMTPTVAVQDIKPPPPAISSLDQWRQTRIDAIVAQFPVLKAWHNTARSGSWAESAQIVSGGHPSAKLRSPEHRALLTCLVIDPPQDPVTARAALNMFMRICPPNQCLDVWEPLVEKHAPNSGEIRTAASVLLDLHAENITASAKQRLSRLVGGS